MATPRTRALVALVAALALGGCAGRTAPPDARAVPSEARRTFRIDNQSLDRIDVYVLGETRDWHVGRLEPGAKAWLTLPERATAGGEGMIRLAVVAGGRLSLRPSRDARAILTLKQPVDALVGQQWTFAWGELTGLRPPARRAPGGRPADRP